MRFAVLALALAATQVFAAQPKAGIYYGDQEISNAPPRASHVLVQPNGDYWTASFYAATNGSGFFAQLGQFYIGTIKAKTATSTNYASGNAVASTVVETNPTPTSVHFVFDNYVRPPQSKPTDAYINDLNLIPDTKGKFNVIAQSFTENPAYGNFSMSITEHAMTAHWNSNCIFSGSMINRNLNWSSVTWTLKANCYAPDNTTMLLKNSKMVGVFYESQTTQGVGDKPIPIYVLIMKTEDGKIAFAKAFLRRTDIVKGS